MSHRIIRIINPEELKFNVNWWHDVILKKTNPYNVLIVDSKVFGFESFWWGVNHKLRIYEIYNVLLSFFGIYYIFIY